MSDTRDGATQRLGAGAHAAQIASAVVGELDDLVTAIDDAIGDGDGLGKGHVLAEVLHREGRSKRVSTVENSTTRPSGV